MTLKNITVLRSWTMGKLRQSWRAICPTSENWWSQLSQVPQYIFVSSRAGDQPLTKTHTVSSNGFSANTWKWQPMFVSLSGTYQYLPWSWISISDFVCIYYQPDLKCLENTGWKIWKIQKFPILKGWMLNLSSQYHSVRLTDNTRIQIPRLLADYRKIYFFWDNKYFAFLLSS